MFLPKTCPLLPGSIRSLLEERPRNALLRTNAAFTRMRHSLVGHLAVATRNGPEAPMVALFARGLLAAALPLNLGRCCHITTFYVFLKGIARILVDIGNPVAG